MRPLLFKPLYSKSEQSINHIPSFHDFFMAVYPRLMQPEGFACHATAETRR